MTLATIMIATYRSSEKQRAASPDEWRTTAQHLAGLDGLQWKYWLRAPDGRLGGVYLFDTAEQACAGGEQVAASLAAAGASEVDLRFFDVDAGLSALTRAWLPAGR